MKKTYQSPKILLEVMTTQQLLQVASLTGIVEDGQDLSVAPETTETSGNLSRRTVWDDVETFDEEDF